MNTTMYSDICQIVSTTHNTVNELLKYKNWPDALALYFRYIQQTKMQMTNTTLSHDSFLMQWLWWAKSRFYSAKKILQDKWFIEQVVRKNKEWKVDWWYVKVNFIMNINHSPNIDIVAWEKDKNHNPKNPDSGKTETNALYNKYKSFNNKENIYIYIYIQKNIKSIYNKYINECVNPSLLFDVVCKSLSDILPIRTIQTEERYSVKKHMDKWLTIWRENSIRVKDSCWRIIPQPRKINDNIVKLFIVKSKRYTDEEFEYAVKVYWETVCAPWYKYKPLWFDDFLARKEWWLEKYVNKVLEEKQEKGVMESFMTDFIKHDSM